MKYLDLGGDPRQRIRASMDEELSTTSHHISGKFLGKAGTHGSPA